MLRNILKYILIIVVGLGILAGVGLYVAARPIWVRERVRDILAQELANRTSREVQVGQIEGNLLTGIIVNDLAIAEKEGLSEGVVLGAERVRIKYDLMAVLRGQVAAAASVEQVDLYKPYAKIVRDEAGRINLARIFPPAKVLVPPEKRFAGKVVVHDAIIDLEDQTLLAKEGKSLPLRLTEVQGEVAVNPHGPLNVTLQASNDAGRFTSAEIELRADTEKRIFSMEGSVVGLDAPWWYDLFVQSPQFRLTQGRVDGNFSLWSMLTDSESSDVGRTGVSPARQPDGRDARRTGYFAWAAISGGRGVAVALSPGEIAFCGEVCVTPEGLNVEMLNANWAGVGLQASGVLFDFSNPTVDLAVNIRGLRRRHLASLLPQQALPEMVGLNSLTTQAQIVGQWPHVSLGVKSRGSQPMKIVPSNLTEISVTGLEFEACMPDSASPTVLGWATVKKIEPGTITLNSLTPNPSPSRRGEHTITISALDNLRVDLLYAGQTPVMETAIVMDEVTIDEVTVANLEASVQAVGESLRVEGLQAEALGGRIIGHGLIQNALADAPTVYFDGLAQDLDLTALQSLPLDLPEDLSGQANVVLTGTVENNVPTIMARIHTRQLQANDIQIDDIVGLAEVEGDVISFPLIQATDPKGLVWVQGQYDTGNGGGDFTAKVAAAEVDIGAVGRQLGQPNLAGVGYIAGDITGQVEDPEGRLEIVAFEPAYQYYGADVVAFTVDGNLKEMTVAELWAARDAAIITGQGQLANIDLGEGSADLAGDFKVVGLQVEDVAELTGRSVPMTGRAEAQLALAGTLRQPAVSGKVHLAYGSFRDYSVDAASLSFVLAEDTLEFSDATVRAQDAVIKGEGKIWNIFDRPQYTAQLTARGVHLQDIAPLQQMGLPIAGEVEIPLARINSGESGPEGEGRLIASDIAIGSEEVHNVDTLVTIQGNQIQLPRTTLQVAGGQVDSEATYDWQRQQLTADVNITDADIPRLLRLAASIAAVQAGAKTENGKKVAQLLGSLSLRGKGQITVHAQMSGSIPDLRGKLQLELARIGLDRKPLPDVSGQLAIKVADGKIASVSDIDVEMRRGDGLLILTGDVEPDKQLSLVADATNFNLALWRQWLPPGLKIGGTMAFTILATGPTNSPDLKGSVDILNANFRGVGFDLLSVPIVTITEERINIDTLILKRGEQQIVMDGYLPFTWNPPSIPVDKDIRFAAKVENTDIGFFPPLIDEFIRGGDSQVTAPTVWAQLKAQGQVDSEISITGTITQPVLGGYLTIAEAKISRPSWKYPLQGINVDLQFARRQQENVLEMRQVEAGWDNTTLTMDGQAYINYLTSSDLLKNHFNLALKVEAPQQQLWPGTTLTNLGGEVTLATQSEGAHLLAVKQLGGKLGKGSVYLSGTYELSKFGPNWFARLADNEADLRLELKEAEVNYADLYDGVIAGVITAQNPQPDAAVQIAGLLTARNARLGVPSGGGEGPRELRGFAPDFPSPTFDVAVAIGPQVAFSGAGVNAPLRLTQQALVISGTPQRPVIAGEVQVEPGKTKVPTGIVKIVELGVKYRLGPALASHIVPVKLEFAGEVKGAAEQIISSAIVDGQPLGPVHIYYEISGALPPPVKVEVSSEPPLSEEQIYAIVGREPFARLAATGPSAGFSDIVSKQFMGLLAAGFRAKIFEPLEAELRRALGLSEFSVYFAFDQPLEVRIGKYLVRDLSVSYRHTVISETTDEWDLSLSYQLPRRLGLSYTTNESGETQVRVGRTYRF